MLWFGYTLQDVFSLGVILLELLVPAPSKYAKHRHRVLLTKVSNHKVKELELLFQAITVTITITITITITEYSISIT